MKFFISLCERTRKTGWNPDDRFLIFFLVPEISAFKELYMAPKIGSSIFKTLAKEVKFLTSLGLHVNRKII